MSTISHKGNIISRLWQYQAERFPIVAHGLLITVFTFSAISFSRMCRGAHGFISMTHFLGGVATTFSLFFLLRIIDEFKDRKGDAAYRSHLPVPRGLVTLRELGNLGSILFLAMVTIIVVLYPSMLWMMGIVLIYLALMTAEFFAPKFLNKNLLIYATSHMMIIPLIDIYASGLDWFLEGAAPHVGLLIFFIVSFFNGMVLEIGRKIRAPKDESEGVDTYSSQLGVGFSLSLWVGVLLMTFVFAVLACHYVALPSFSYALLSGMLIVCLVIAARFWKNKNEKTAKMIEISSGIWTLTMYAIIGGVPGLIALLS